MAFKSTIIASLLLVAQAEPQVPGSSGKDSVLGQIPAILGGNVPAIQNPNSPINSKEALASVGTGKYPARLFADPSLPNHVIYSPKDITANLKTPILLWGNGGCVAAGTIMAPFLLQIASQGITVLANGGLEKEGQPLTYNTMRSYGQSNSTWMKTALEWAEKQQQAGSKEYAHFDLGRVAAGGQSCGGMEAAVMSADPRIKTIGMFNSGFSDRNSSAAPPKNSAPKSGGGMSLPNMGNVPDGSKFRVPVFYFLGGETDIATLGGQKDFGKLASGVPSWLGNWAPGGHGGTYNEVNGGIYGVTASNWLKWVFFGDKQAAEYFKTDKPAAEGWTAIQKKDLNNIPVKE